MTTRKIAQKIPFKPTKKQVMFFADCFGARRFAYNSQVAVFNTYSKENKDLVYPKITDLKRENEWLKTSVVPSHSLSNGTSGKLERLTSKKPITVKIVQAFVVVMIIFNHLGMECYSKGCVKMEDTNFQRN